MKHRNRKPTLLRNISSVTAETGQRPMQFIFNAAHYHISKEDGEDFPPASRVEEKLHQVLQQAELKEFYRIIMDYVSHLVDRNPEDLHRINLYSAEDLKEQDIDRENVRILINAAECEECGEEVWSLRVHDFNSCKCGKVKVDGGLAYIKRTVKDRSVYNDKSVFIKKNGGDN